jgi:hypothetical protein
MYLMKGHEIIGFDDETDAHGTFDLFRCILAVTVKSLSKKCLLHTYVPYSNNAE